MLHTLCTDNIISVSLKCSKHVFLQTTFEINSYILLFSISFIIDSPTLKQLLQVTYKLFKVILFYPSQLYSSHYLKNDVFWKNLYAIITNMEIWSTNNCTCLLTLKRKNVLHFSVLAIYKLLKITYINF